MIAAVSWVNSRCACVSSAMSNINKLSGVQYGHALQRLITLAIIIVKFVAVPTVRPLHKSILINYLRILANVTQTASNNLARNGHCLFEIAL